MTICVSHVSKTIRGVEVLRDVSLEAPSGRVTGLQGVNGSGKTMIMRAVCGLIRPTLGTITVNDVELDRPGAFPASLGMMIEGPAFIDSRTGFDNLKLLADILGLVDAAAVEQAIRDVGLDPHLRKRYRTYSLGMKQRLGIAAAIMEQPEVVVLDEPTNALDASGVQMLKGIVAGLRARGCTVLMSCHDTAVLRLLCDRIYHMAEGHIEGVEELRHEGAVGGETEAAGAVAAGAGPAGAGASAAAPVSVPAAEEVAPCVTA